MLAVEQSVSGAHAFSGIENGRIQYQSGKFQYIMLSGKNLVDKFGLRYI